RVVAGEATAHDLPRVPVVGGAEDVVARDPELVRLPARVEDGKRPLEAVAVLGGGHAHAVLLGPHRDHPLLPRTVVVVDQSSRAGAGPDGAADHDGGIGRLDRGVAAFTAAGLNPVGLGAAAT